MTEEPRIDFRIPEPNLARLEERIALLNKRAAKLGVAPVALERTGREDVLIYRWTDGAERLDPQHPGDRPSRVKVIILVRVSGETPKLAGWEFLATLDHASEAGVILRVVPGVELPESYRTALPTCDHCRLTRNRRETFVLRHEDGTLKEVGRNCLVDFLGGANPSAIAAWCEWLGAFRADLEASEGEGWGGGGAAYFYLPDYLGMVAAVIDTSGWVSRKAARDGAGEATADAASHWMIPPLGGWTRRDLERRPVVTEAHRELVERALGWARSLRETKPALSDYEHNLVVVCAPEALAPKNAGIAASLIAAYKRDVEHEILRRRRVERAAASAFVGTVGTRGEFTVEVVNVIEYEGNWGVTRIHKMLDDAGNALVWFASREGGFAQGRRYRIKATVKAHEEDPKWGKQTVLSRAVKLAEVDDVVEVGAGPGTPTEGGANGNPDPSERT
jgi:hypothetical protein